MIQSFFFFLLSTSIGLGTAFGGELPAPADALTLFHKDAKVQAQIEAYRHNGFTEQGEPQQVQVTHYCPTGGGTAPVDPTLCDGSVLVIQPLVQHSQYGDSLVSVVASVFVPSRMSRRPPGVKLLAVD